MHYHRWQRHGDPTVTLKTRRMGTPEERFRIQVNTDGLLIPNHPELGPCHNWTGEMDQDGYGRFSLNHTKAVRAHNFALSLVNRICPEGLTPDHLCHSLNFDCPIGICIHRTCVNPDHIDFITQLENVQRWTIRVTHCPQGHEYNEANTQWKGPNRSFRSCRVCAREYATRRRESRL